MDTWRASRGGPLASQGEREASEVLFLSTKHFVSRGSHRHRGSLKDKLQATVQAPAPTLIVSQTHQLLLQVYPNSTTILAPLNGLLWKDAKWGVFFGVRTQL